MLQRGDIVKCCSIAALGMLRMRDDGIVRATSNDSRGGTKAARRHLGSYCSFTRDHPHFRVFLKPSENLFADYLVG